ncbi:MAG: hypothetical protein OIN66_07790 [Candidatus Methanoperedens sp.]|nr:hypothetical protein [Candidatus Methanoperedens sp.]
MVNYIEHPRYVLNYKKLVFIGALWGMLSFSVVTSCKLNIIKLNHIEPQILIDLSFLPGTLTHNTLIALQDRTGFFGEYTHCLLCAIFTIIISMAIVFAAGMAYQKLLMMREK